MRSSRTLFLLLVAAADLMVSATVAAQAPVAQPPGRPTTDQQMSGEAVFYQKVFHDSDACGLSHEHDAFARLFSQRKERGPRRALSSAVGCKGGQPWPYRTSYVW